MNFLLENAEQITLIFVNILTAALGYAVGRKHQLFLEKRSRLMARYQNLYAPFERLYVKICTGAFYFTDMPISTQEEFLTILYDNYEYTDSKLKNLIYEFNCNYRGNDIDIETANLKFYEIACRISEQFDKLSKKLFFEPHNPNV
nr:hypothetical protein [uncultured Clostridium sp.]